MLVREGDQAGQCRAWYLRAQAAWIAGRVGQADAAWCEAAVCARLAGDERELFRILGMRATAAVLGPTPVDEAIARCEGFRELVGASPVAAALMVNPLASLHAMRGEFELADGFLREANETLDQLGSLGWVSHHERAGAPARGSARRWPSVPLREAVERLASMGDGELLATTLAMLAQAVYAQGQIDGGRAAVPDGGRRRRTRRHRDPSDLAGRHGEDPGRRGRAEEAEELARDAVALVAPTDLLSHRGDAMLDLADGTAERIPAPMSITTRLKPLWQCTNGRAMSIGAVRARALLGQPSPGDVEMGFSGNFTAVTFGDDPEVAGKKALFIQGRTDATDPPQAIHVVMLRSRRASDRQRAGARSGRLGR